MHAGFSSETSILMYNTTLHHISRYYIIVAKRCDVFSSFFFEGLVGGLIRRVTMCSVFDVLVICCAVSRCQTRASDSDCGCHVRLK